MTRAAINSCITMQFSNVVLVTDSSSLAASISSGLARVGLYFPVLESPRMLRSDASNEIMRVANALHSLRPSIIIYGDVSEQISSLIAEIIDAPYRHVNSNESLSRYVDVRIPVETPPLFAAPELHRRLRGQGAAKKVVICEYQPENATSVIAANYAIAHDADFFLVNVSDNIKKRAVAGLNAISSTPHSSIRQIDIDVLTKMFNELLPDIAWDSYEQAVYITDGIPLGLCIPGLPALHTDIVNVGQQIARNIQDRNYALGNRDGMFGLFCHNTDNDFDTSRELAAADESISRTRGIFRRVGTYSTVLTNLMLETIPYDVLYIATHGVRVRGIENLYRIKMGSAVHEVLIHESLDKTTYDVVEVIEVDGEKVEGSGWTEAHAKVKGATWELIKDGKMPNVARTNGIVDMQRREIILGSGDGAGSSGAFDVIASGYRPMVIINACGSWIDISERFIFAGASVFIGTYWPVSHATAIKFAEEFFRHLYDMEVYEAFELARNQLSGQDRLAYVISGTLENRFGTGGRYHIDAFTVLKDRVDMVIKKQRAELDEPSKIPKESQKYIDQAVWYLEKFREELIDVYKEALGQE